MEFGLNPACALAVLSSQARFPAIQAPGSVSTMRSILYHFTK